MAGRSRKGGGRPADLGRVQRARAHGWEAALAEGDSMAESKVITFQFPAELSDHGWLAPSA